MQRRFVSDVSHELRTPLTTVRMAGDVLHDARADFDPATARAAELLQTELDRFETLLADLLEISRFDAGAAVLELDDVNLVDVAHRIVDATRPLAEQRNVQVVVRAPDHAVPGRGRRTPGRADRAQPGHQRHRPRRRGRPDAGIVVQVAGDDHAAAIAVRDHGVGLAPGESAMVFNRFWRADPARARTSGGTGLGLSIALEDTHLHGGWLQAWGRPGEGAQFRLTLPRRAGGVLRHSPLPLVPDRRRGAGLVRRRLRAPLLALPVWCWCAGCVRVPDRRTGRGEPGPRARSAPTRASSSTRGRRRRARPAPRSSTTSSTRCRRPRSRPGPPGSSSPRTPRRPGTRSSRPSRTPTRRCRARPRGGVSVTLTGADRLDQRGAWQGALPPDERTIDLPDGDARTASGASTRRRTR